MVVDPKKNNILLEKVGVAQAPSKDYGQLLVTKTQVIFRMWRITPRTADAIKFRPKQWTDTFEDFLSDESIQREICRFFGPQVLQETKNLAIGGNGLLRLPEKVMIRVAASLSLVDIKRLGRVCRLMNKFCNSNNLWHTLFLRHYPTVVVPDALIKVAAKQGWKRVFFTNKLQLQVQLRKEKTGSATTTSSHYDSDERSLTRASASSPNGNGVAINVEEPVEEHMFDLAEDPGDVNNLESGRWSSLLLPIEGDHYSGSTSARIRPSSTPANQYDKWNPEIGV